MLSESDFILFGIFWKLLLRYWSLLILSIWYSFDGTLFIWKLFEETLLKFLLLLLLFKEKLFWLLGIFEVIKSFGG